MCLLLPNRVGERRWRLMNIDDALIEESGCIKHTSKCFICDNKINWFAPVKSTRIEPNRVQAEIIVERPSIINGHELIADIDIVVKCPICGIQNKFSHIKWKIKNLK